MRSEYCYARHHDWLVVNNIEMISKPCSMRNVTSNVCWTPVSHHRRQSCGAKTRS
ncbi:unnamed protein product [Amoebophrya sp. A25]|nr:unnamed protein product [Amoebophrya sp. A25]|eukprot:GSA25T00020262001.1